MPFLIPIFTFLAGLAASAHIGATIATANEQVALRVAQAQVTPVFRERCNQISLECQFGYVVDERGCQVGCASSPDQGNGKEKVPEPPGYNPDKGSGDEQCLRDMIRSVNDFERNQVPDMARRLKDIEREKIAVPPSVPQGIEEVKRLIARAKTATTCQDMQEMRNEMQSRFEDANNQLRDLDQAANDARCLRDTTRNLDDYERNPIRDMARRLKEIDREKITIPPTVTQGIEEVKRLIARAKTAATCQDMQDMQRDMQSRFEDVQSQLRDLDQAANDARCVRDMGRDMKGRERNMVRDLERRVKQLARQKVPIPQEVTETIAKMKELFAQAKQAATCEDIQEFQQQVNELQNNSQEFFMRLDFLAQAPRMQKEITREFTRISRQWKSARTRAARANLADLIGKGDELFGQLQGLFDRFRSLVSSGDFEQIQAFMEEQESARDIQESLFDVMGAVEALRNAPRFISQMTKEATALRRTAWDIERRDGDATQLTACVDSMDAAIADAKNLSRQRPVDTEALAGAFESLQDQRSQCQEAVGEINGEKEAGIFDNFVDKKFQGMIQNGFNNPPRLAPPETKMLRPTVPPTIAP